MLPRFDAFLMFIFMLLFITLTLSLLLSAGKIINDGEKLDSSVPKMLQIVNA